MTRPKSTSGPPGPSGPQSRRIRAWPVALLKLTPPDEVTVRPSSREESLTLFNGGAMRRHLPTLDELDREGR